MGWAAFAGDMLNKRFQTISLNYSFNSVKLVCKDIHCAIAAECPCHIYSTYSTLHPFFFFPTASGTPLDSDSPYRKQF